MEFERILADVLQLPLPDRISFVQRILESVASDTQLADALTLSPELQTELDRRVAQDEAHPDSAIPWELIEAESATRERR